MSLFFSGKCGSDPVLEIVARAVNKNTKDIENFKTGQASVDKTQNEHIENIVSDITDIKSKIQEIINSTPIKYVVDLSVEGAVEYDSDKKFYYLNEDLANEIEEKYGTIQDDRDVEVYINWGAPYPSLTGVIDPLFHHLKVNRLLMYKQQEVIKKYVYTATDGNTFAIWEKGYLTTGESAQEKWVLRTYNIVDILTRFLPTHVGETKIDPVTRESYKVGNVITNDGMGDEINVTDVVALAEFTMTSDMPEGFVKAAADCNGDEEVDVTDVVTLANFVMGG